MSETSVKKIEKKSGGGSSKKPNRLAAIPKYFKDVIAELKRVSWPSRKELINSTGAVIVFVVVMSVIVGVFDLGLGKLLQLLYNA